MDTNALQGTQPVFCAQVNKVYDWVTSQVTKTTPVVYTFTNTDISAAAIPPGTNGASNLTCTIDSTTATVISKDDVEIQIDDTTITLQSVTFEKTIDYTVTGTFTTNGNPDTPPVTFSFSSSVSYNETVVLCAPEYTQFSLSVSPTSLITVSVSSVTPTAVPIDGNEGVISFSLESTICQSILITFPVVVELSGAYCTPREDIVINCAQPTMPPQCPLIFGPPSN